MKHLLLRTINTLRYWLLQFLLVEEAYLEMFKEEIFSSLNSYLRASIYLLSEVDFDKSTKKELQAAQRKLLQGEENTEVQISAMPEEFLLYYVDLNRVLKYIPSYKFKHFTPQYAWVFFAELQEAHNAYTLAYLKLYYEKIELKTAPTPIFIPSWGEA